MKDTLLSSQASHATRGTVSRQPLGAPDQAYQTKTRMSNPNPSPGQSHDHPDRQTASRRLDQAYQIRSPKSTRLTSPATTPNNPETNPDHPTQPATLRQPVRLYPSTIPKSNPDLSGYTLQTHHIHGQPKEERQNHTPTKPPRNPGQPRKDSENNTHPPAKCKIGPRTSVLRPTRDAGDVVLTQCDERRPVPWCTTHHTCDDSSLHRTDRLLAASQECHPAGKEVLTGE